MPDVDCYVVSKHVGLFEPCFNLGEMVRTGDIVARIYDIDRTGKPPVEYKARTSGTLAGRHFPV